MPLAKLLQAPEWSSKELKANFITQLHAKHKLPDLVKYLYLGVVGDPVRRRSERQDAERRRPRRGHRRRQAQERGGQERNRDDGAPHLGTLLY